MAFVDIYYTSKDCVQQSITFANVLAIINTLITASVGIWLGYSFKKNHETNKAVKDYFVVQTNTIIGDYNLFITLLCENKINPSDIIAWFKKMTIRISDFESIIKREYKIQINCLEKHNKFKTEFTNSNFFNENYKTSKFILPSKEKWKIYKIQAEILKNYTELVILIIKAKKIKSKK